MSTEENAVKIARITAAVATGTLAEEIGDRMITELRQATGTDDSVVGDVAQEVAGAVMGVGSLPADSAEIATRVTYAAAEPVADVVSSAVDSVSETVSDFIPDLW